jgi:hypothetical protein
LTPLSSSPPRGASILSPPHVSSEIHTLGWFILIVAEEIVSLSLAAGESVVDLSAPAMLPNP